MIWPEAIKISVEAVQAVDFLTQEQKRDIFYNNAALSSGSGRRRSRDITAAEADELRTSRLSPSKNVFKS
jgi:hypothetical protein